MLKFIVNNQIIKRDDDFDVVAGSRNYLTAEFEMTEEWHDAVALFVYGDECFHAVIGAEGRCIVPHEVIKPPFFSVSVFCAGETFITANSVCVAVQKSGFVEGAEPSEPTPELWNQYITEMQATIEKGIPHIGENQNWFLYNAESQLYEDSGVSAKGATPVKGADYWTESDKKEIIEGVIASLPDADQMSFPLEETVSEVSEG